MNLKLHGFLICIPFLSLMNVYANEVVLFTDGRLESNYRYRLLRVEVEDTLVFSDHVKFHTYGLLGRGNSDAIFDIGDGKALRVPQYLFKLPKEPYVRHFHTGYFLLKEYGVAIPEVYLNESSRKKYIVVSKENVRFKLSDFSYEINKMKLDIGEDSARECIYELVEFARSTAHFKYIDDFRGDNIVWTGDRWLLIDWDSQHQLAKFIDDETVFSNSISRKKIRLPHDIEEELDRAIKNEREKFLK